MKLSFVVSRIKEFADILDDYDLSEALQVLAALDAEKPIEELSAEVHKAYISASYLAAKYGDRCRAAEDKRSRFRTSFEAGVRKQLTDSGFGRATEAMLHAALLEYNAYHEAHEDCCRKGVLRDILNALRDASYMCQYTLTEASRRERNILSQE